MTKLIFVMIFCLMTMSLSSCLPPTVRAGEVRIEKHNRTGPIEGGYFEVIVVPPGQEVPNE